MVASATLSPIFGSTNSYKDILGFIYGWFSFAKL
jgi:hypothetical protein